MSPSVAYPGPSAPAPSSLYFSEGSPAGLSWKFGMQLYNDLIQSGDFRTKGWPLVDTPLYPLVTIAVYLLFCVNARKITSRWPDVKLRPVLIAYNFALVCLSAYMCYEFFASAVMSRLSWVCNPVQMDTEYQNMRLARVCWLYYISKYIEMLETLLFAMRKKYNQISFLHVYHHSTMVFFIWVSMKVAAGGMTFLYGGINCFVHTVMYSYYCLSSFGPHMQKYLWWKKYITKLQLCQLMIMFPVGYNIIHQDCGYSLLLTKMQVVYAVTLILLFSNFYFKSYLTSKTSETLLNENGKQRKISKDCLPVLRKKEI